MIVYLLKAYETVHGDDLSQIRLLQILNFKIRMSSCFDQITLADSMIRMLFL